MLDRTSKAPEEKHATRLARAYQSLRGLAIGDALGHALTTPGQDRFVFDPPPWRFTDDTEMATAIVEQLQTRGAIDQDALAVSFAQRFVLQPERGYGRSPIGSCRRSNKGCRGGKRPRPHTAARVRKGTGPPCAWLRSAPISPTTRMQPWPRRSGPRRSHTCTCRGKRVLWPSPWQRAISCAIRRQASEPCETLLFGIDDDELRAGLGRAIALEDASGPDAGRELGTGETVRAIDTVPFALWAALSRPRDFHGAITLALSGLAGPAADKDTVCAVVGGLVALSAERNTIPAEWIESAEPVPLHQEA